MTRDSANLSIDFLVGFTIFMLAFIWVATMIPGIMVGLQANTLDYDAVAYRTGVILMEDPGWPAEPGWETVKGSEKIDVIRFGLASSKDTPNILSANKVDRFFCSTEMDPDIGFVYPQDYQQRAIFGERPYHFNISLQDAGREQIRAVGEVLPDSYGYIRRLGKIKGISNASLDTRYYTAHKYVNEKWPWDNVTTHQFAILVNSTKLKTDIRDPTYQIDPPREPVIINLTEVRSTIRATDPSIISVNITDITVWGKTNNPANNGWVNAGKLPKSNNPFIDGNTTPVDNFPFPVTNNVSFVFQPQNKFFENYFTLYPEVLINVTFTLDNPRPFLNNSLQTPFEYNYNPANVTQPRLRDAVVEVAVW
jgi:hypothetical protein